MDGKRRILSHRLSFRGTLFGKNGVQTFIYPPFLVANFPGLVYTLYKHLFERVGHMQSQIAKWGNSLGIRIPKSIIEKVGFTEGTPVILEIVDEAIVIRKKKYDLKALLSQVTSENLHAEIDTGYSLGRETW
ncbi:AbrB/MazE/SpoVT family DNA-binding domain-containing protein [Desulfofundulus australicus]|jgi:antitoxin MazE|nr:AbrB/MazE/SpoVT family DNA-binding domain-containing protein [Desulfofundulus australicus]